MNTPRPLTLLRDRFERAIRPAQEKLQNTLLGMTPRDRWLLAGLVVFGLIVVLVLGGTAMHRSLKGLESDLQSRQQQITMMNELKSSLFGASGKKDEVNAQLAAHKDTTLSAYLEKAADKVQIRDNLKQVRERSTTNIGDLEEKQYTVQLSRLSLDQFGSYLYEIEASGYPLKIRSTKVKTLVVGGQKTLDVTLEVSAYRLMEKAQEEGT
jgi:type II secretory pathway component PulM